MSENKMSTRGWLAAVVIAHLGISMVHGQAHDGAHVPLSYAATLFVFIVILAGPIAGLALTWLSKQIGGWVIALTMAGAFLFGCLNHFVLAGPDHVMHVTSAWRPLFTMTAILLAATEAVAAGLAVRYAQEWRYAR
jgi:hypothetical protein